MYTSELEGNIALGFRAFDGSNYEVRCSIAKYLAILLAASQDIFLDTNQSKILIVLFLLNRTISRRFDE
jgi:hypothetical protein